MGGPGPGTAGVRPDGGTTVDSGAVHEDGRGAVQGVLPGAGVSGGEGLAEERRRVPGPARAAREADGRMSARAVAHPAPGGEIISQSFKATKPPIYLRRCRQIADSASRQISPALTCGVVAKRRQQVKDLVAGCPIYGKFVESISDRHACVDEHLSLESERRQAGQGEPSSSARVTASRRPLGMHGPMSLVSHGRTASLSCVPQNDRQRTCLPGASYSSERSAPQPGTGHCARHCPFRSRRPPRAGDQ